MVVQNKLLHYLPDFDTQLFFPHKKICSKIAWAVQSGTKVVTNKTENVHNILPSSQAGTMDGGRGSSRIAWRQRTALSNYEIMFKW